MHSAVLIYTILSTCLASFGYAESRLPVYKPGHHPRPTRCSTTTISEMTTSTVPPSTITETATTTELPSTVTQTATTTATSITTITVSSDCDLPVPNYDLGTCTWAPTVYFGPNSPRGGYWTETPHHYYLNWGTDIFNRLCGALQADCNPPEETMERCAEATAAALAAGYGQEAADIWNSIMASCT